MRADVPRPEHTAMYREAPDMHPHLRKVTETG